MQVHSEQKNRLQLPLAYLRIHPLNNIFFKPNHCARTDLYLLWKTTFFHVCINKCFSNTGHLNDL